MRKKLIALSILALCSCTTNHWTFPIDEDGPVGSYKRSEICQIKRELLSFNRKKPFDSGMRGGVLIDGTFENIQPLANGLQRVTFKVTKILLHEESDIGREISVITNSHDQNMVHLVPINYYRVFAVYMRNKYYAVGAMIVELSGRKTLNECGE